jgi:hypothetical protein
MILRFSGVGTGTPLASDLEVQMIDERVPGAGALLLAGQQLISTAFSGLVDLVEVTLRISGLREQPEPRVFKVRSDCEFSGAPIERGARRAFARGLVQGLRRQGHEVELAGSLAEGSIALWITVNAGDPAAAVEQAQRHLTEATANALRAVGAASPDGGMSVKGVEALELSAY